MADNNKEVVELAGLLTKIANETATIIDTRMRTAIDNNTGDIKQHLTNYMLYMQTMAMMAALSSEVWVKRKLMKVAKTPTNEFAISVGRFKDAVMSLIKPLTHFAQLYTGDSKSSKSGGIGSLMDVVTTVERLSKKIPSTVSEVSETVEPKQGGYEHLKERLILGGVEIDHAQATYIKGGNETEWVGGFQISEMLVRHMSKLEILRQDPTANADVTELLSMVVNGVLTLSAIAKAAEIDKGIRMVIWVGDVVPKYLERHATTYRQYIDADSIGSENKKVSKASKASSLTENLLETYIAESTGWYDELMNMDRRILMGAALLEFDMLRSVKTAAQFAKELMVLKEIPNDVGTRSHVMSEINGTNEDIIDLASQIDLTDTGVAVADINEIVAYELQLKPRLTEIETTYNKIAQLLTKLADHWTMLASPDVTETCMRHKIACMRRLVRADVLGAIAKKKKFDPVESLNPYNSVSVYADTQLNTDELWRLTEKMI
jgi:hypothetical protein